MEKLKLFIKKQASFALAYAIDLRNVFLFFTFINIQSAFQNSIKKNRHRSKLAIQ